MNLSAKPSFHGIRLGTAALLAAIVLGLTGGQSLSVGALSAGALSAGAETTADDGRGILRYKYNRVDQRLELVPISPDELKVGHIYSHFSERLKRRVWSYLQENGQFWYAFGEGTTQEAWRLDVDIPPEEEMKIVEREAPRLVYALQRGITVLYARLNSSNDWKIAPTASHPTIYNLETGYRWDWLSDKYIPVRSTYGYRWTLKAGQYVPVEPATLPAHR